MRIYRSRNGFTSDSLYNSRQVTSASIDVFIYFLKFSHSTSATKKMDYKAPITFLPFSQFHWSILLILWYFNKGMWIIFSSFSEPWISSYILLQKNIVNINTHRDIDEHKLWPIIFHLFMNLPLVIYLAFRFR